MGAVMLEGGSRTSALMCERWAGSYRAIIIVKQAWCWSVLPMHRADQSGSHRQVVRASWLALVSQDGATTNCCILSLRKAMLGKGRVAMWES